MPASSSAFYHSLAPTSAYARHLSRSLIQTSIYHNPPPVPVTQRSERDILLTHHRFLRSSPPPCTDSNTSYEHNLAIAYDSKLYKEFVLIELSQYRLGRVAMRWRTEAEVKAGKGERVCAALGCEKRADREREVLFTYVEDREQQEALVKVRLCERCARKLAKAKEKEKEGGESADIKKEGGRGRRRSPARGGDGEVKESEQECERRNYRRRDDRGEDADTERRSRRKRDRSRSRSPRDATERQFRKPKYRA